MKTGTQLEEGDDVLKLFTIVSLFRKTNLNYVNYHYTLLENRRLDGYKRQEKVKDFRPNCL